MLKVSEIGAATESYESDTLPLNHLHPQDDLHVTYRHETFLHVQYQLLWIYEYCHYVT